MATATASRTGTRGAPARPLSTDTRWMRVFIAIGIAVVLVVAGFLIVIIHTLNSINSGLTEANSAVTSVQGNAKPLSFLIDGINHNLGPVDAALRPVPGQGRAIDSTLGTINGKLTSVSGSLSNTTGLVNSTAGSLSGTSGTLGTVAGTLQTVSGSLSSTSGILGSTEGRLRSISGSLANTSGVLVRVHGLLGSINSALISAERPGATNGTAQIPINVRKANAELAPAEANASSILGGLTSVNGHLASVCRAPVLSNPVIAIAGLVDSSGAC